MLSLSNKISSSNTAQTATTASVTFANNTLYILSVGANSSSGNIAFVTPVTTGLTWVNVALSNAAVTTVGIWCAYVASGAGANTTALDSGQVNTTRMRWSIEAVLGSAATAANNGSDAFGTPGFKQRTTNQTSVAVPLGAFADAAYNVAFGFIFLAASNTITPETGYTTLSSGAAINGSHLVEYNLGQDAAVDATFPALTVVATAVEIKAAAGAHDYVGLLAI